MSVTDPDAHKNRARHQDGFRAHVSFEPETGLFTVDEQSGTVTCPAGHTAALGRPHAGGTRLARFKVLCRGCPVGRSARDAG